MEKESPTRTVGAEFTNTDAGYFSPLILGGWSVLFIKVSKEAARIAAKEY